MSTEKQFGIKDLEKQFGPLTFSKFIKSWRISEDFSQTIFAKKLGISKANLCDIEKNRKRVSITRAAKIAKVLKLPVEGIVLIALEDMIREAGLKFRLKVDSKVKKAA
jgi:DNA-binding XRE family transcriptional regulator